MPTLSPARNERCQIIKHRVNDWLAQRDVRQTFESRREVQRRFVKAAIRIGRERGMRLWSDKTVPMEQSALQSLLYLLEEKTILSTTSGQRNTGGGRDWVLDLWEAALDESIRPLAAKVERPVIEAPEEVPDECGVAVFAEPVKVKPNDWRAPSGFSNRLLEAFASDDVDTFIELAREVEAWEVAA